MSTSKTQIISQQGWYGPLRSFYKVNFWKTDPRERHILFSWSHTIRGLPMWWCVVGVWGWSHLTSKNKMGEKSRVALYSREGARTRDRSSCSASSTIQAREQEALCTQLHRCLNRSQPTEGFQGALLNIIFHLWSKREVEGLHELKNEFLSLRTWLQEDCLSYCISFVHIFCVCVCVCMSGWPYTLA